MNLRKSFYLIGTFVVYYGMFLLFPITSYFLVMPNNELFSSNAIILKSIPFVISSILTLIMGFTIRHISYDEESIKADLTRKDGFLLASFIWIFAGIFGALPYFFSSINYEFAGFFINPVFKDNIIVNSIFESVSGITTTGASVFSVFPNSS